MGWRKFWIYFFSVEKSILNLALKQARALKTNFKFKYEHWTESCFLWVELCQCQHKLACVRILTMATQLRHWFDVNVTITVIFTKFRDVDFQKIFLVLARTIRQKEISKADSSCPSFNIKTTERTRLSYNCAHLRLTKESLTIEYWIIIFLWWRKRTWKENIWRKKIYFCGGEKQWRM